MKCEAAVQAEVAMKNISPASDLGPYMSFVLFRLLVKIRGSLNVYLKEKWFGPFLPIS